MRLWIAFIAYIILLAPAYAFTEEQFTGEETFTFLNVENYIKDYVDIPEGGTDWKIFATTKEIETYTKTKDGYDNHYSKPEFQPEVQALDGKNIKIKGYMFPLDGTEEQKKFLFGPFPLTCPFQYHVGPSLVVEVHAQEHPIVFDYEPVTITGTLELVPDDPEYSVFYRLRDAEQVK